MSHSIRELLLAAHKRAQDEADIRRYELEEYERANGSSQPAHSLTAHAPYTPVIVTAQTYTRRSAEDIHD